MKKHLLLAMVVCGLTLSCNSDDDNSPSQNDNDVVGTYRLATFNSPAAADIDGNGTSATDLTTEYDCYADWEIVLDADHTFTRTINVVDANDGQLNCTADIISTGTWTRNGQSLLLTNVVGEGQSDMTLTFSADDQILTHTGSGQYPTVFEEIYVMETGTVTQVYTKVVAN